MKKTILITGCSSGFGKALCREFKEQGYFVIATARNVEKLNDVMSDMMLDCMFCADTYVSYYVEKGPLTPY